MHSPEQPCCLLGPIGSASFLFLPKKTQKLGLVLSIIPLVNVKDLLSWRMGYMKKVSRISLRVFLPDFLCFRKKLWRLSVSQDVLSIPEGAFIAVIPSKIVNTHTLHLIVLLWSTHSLSIVQG